MAVEQRAGQILKAAPQPLAQCREPRAFCLRPGCQLGCQPKACDLMHGQRACPQAALMAATQHLRGDAATMRRRYVQRGNALRPADLVRG